MNPSDANSSLATLRQLKEMLDAGTLTPQEFEALKQKLVFGHEPTVSALPVPPPIQSTPVPPIVHPPAYTVLEEPAESIARPTSLAVENPNWLAAPGPVPVEDNVEANAADNEDEVIEARNPLNLVFAIGGLLVFLALVLYLTLGNRSADEHLTSTSQTAADSTATAPEVGPQAQQITLPPATPETIRIAPAAPLPTVPAPATKFRADSTAPAPSIPVSATPAKAAPTKATSTSAATAAPTDSTTKGGQP